MMKANAVALIFTLVTSSFVEAEISNTGGVIPQVLVDSVKEFFAPGVHKHEDLEKEIENEIVTDNIELINANDTDSNATSIDHHALINMELAEDEERVHAGGDVKIRKKRFLCKRCFAPQSYGYGGGGGCCGSCGQCGGGYRVQPIRIRIPVPVYTSYGGGGCGSCYRPPPCGVCGR